MDSPTDPSQESPPTPEQEEERPVPIGQVIFDNIFLWFLLSVVIAVVFIPVVVGSPAPALRTVPRPVLRLVAHAARPVRGFDVFQCQ